MIRKKLWNRMTALIVSVSLLVGTAPVNLYSAEETPLMMDRIDLESILEHNVPTEVSIGWAVTENAKDMVGVIKFNGGKYGAHGFAAERGNNLIDRIKGTNAYIVGDNNVQNGADRMIIGRGGEITYIQTKYWKSASDTLAACFEKGEFCYIDGTGKPMQIEVPADQYEEAVELYAKQIKEGKIPGVTDPKEASNYVRKGNLTYKQAVNLAKPGTIESLTYDAINGSVSAASAMGLSVILTYAACRINGKDRKEAVKESAMVSLKTGLETFGIAVIAGQLTRAGAAKIFQPSAEALTKALGEDFSEKFIKVFGEKTVIGGSAESATKQAAKLLSTSALTDIVAMVVVSVPDAIDMFRGRISKKQFVTNFAKNAIVTVIATAGTYAGGAIGELLVPGVGVVPGEVVGGLLFSVAGSVGVELLADYITDDDADEMYALLEKEFAQLCENYLVTEQEAKSIAQRLLDKLDDDFFKDMYESVYGNEKTRKYNSPEECAVAILEPLFEAQVALRPRVEAPTEEEYRTMLKEELKGVIYIH